MTGLCHETTEAVSIAARWYAEHRNECGRPLIPTIRKRFNLTPLEACMALAEANRLDLYGGRGDATS
ncbi:hypothetical protein [Mesorhizobium sp. ZC-5]|uniref:hypothetical protein n=1 Tax=Mesorhizobium sp. ZC-5 TaxID=2986066 RepID=UPI0021E75783|nr:hypothetical protein [Mesorhizobium sp. ZC-5]MCV3239671.1 hypothetical protein [Mesorhizobium sp. ZC-5]